MTSNFLLLHSDKTKVIVLVSKNSRKISFTLCITLASNNTVRNLGVVFDQYVTFNANIKPLHPSILFHVSLSGLWSLSQLPIWVQSLQNLQIQSL